MADLLIISARRGISAWVKTNDQNNTIVDCANIFRRFRGQPLDDLTRWLGRDADIYNLQQQKKEKE